MCFVGIKQYYMVAIQRLVELAKQSSSYSASEELLKLKTEGTSDEYRFKVLETLDVETLIGLVYSRPNVFLKKDNSAAALIIDKIEIEPLANLLFCRDQQIVTARGLVMGNTSTTVRKF